MLKLEKILAGEEMRYEKAKDMKDTAFKRLVGVKRHTFQNMVEVVQAAYDAEHKSKRGRKPALTVEDMILLMLSYLRSYATFFETGVNFGVSESTAHRITVWVENVLITSGKFALPSKRVLLTKTSKIEVVIVDVTEQEIERPKKGQKEYYSGKKNVTQ